MPPPPLRPTPPRSSPSPSRKSSPSSRPFSPSPVHSANRSLRKQLADVKENNSDDCNRSSLASHQSWKAPPPTRPWVTHFSKVSSTPSPKKRILSERNEWNSPAKEGCIRGNTGPEVTPEAGSKENPPVKAVAELSKRIEQFLEHEGVLLGVTNGGSREITQVVPATQPGLHNSSPYDPYHSPFFNRPQFLRLHGKPSPVGMAEMVGEQSAAKTPLQLDGEDNLSTPPPLSFGNFDILHAENTPELPVSTHDGDLAYTDAGGEVSEDAKTGGEKGNLVPETQDKEGRAGPVVPESIPALLQEESTDAHAEATLGGSETACGDRALDEGSVAEAPKHETYLAHQVIVQGGENDNGELVADTEEELEDVSERAKITKNVLSATVIGAVLVLVLLASGSPGLLPPPLANNAVSSFWHASRYHQPTVIILHAMEGLWRTELLSATYLPVDIRYIKVKGETLFQSVKQVTEGTSLAIGLQIRTLSWALMQQLEAFLQELLPAEDANHGRRGTFDWIEDYGYEETWSDEHMLAYPDWELVQEYDLQAANEFLLGLMPERVREDMLRNFSLLSDSPEVDAILSDLLESKSGRTKDKAEIYEHYLQLEDEADSFDDGIACTDEPNRLDEELQIQKDESLSTSASILNQELQEEKEAIEKEQIENGLFQVSEDLPAIDEISLRSTISNQEDSPAMLSQPPSSDLLQDDDPSIMHRLEPDHLAAAEDSQIEAVNEKYIMTSAIASDTKETASNLMQKTQNKFKFSYLSKIVTSAVTTCLLIILIRYISSKEAANKLTPSSVQFLSKTYPVQQESSVGELQEYNKPNAPVTMIEELNDTFGSVLQSPDPGLNQWRNSRDEEMLRSPLSSSVDSPFGSFTTYKLVSKKEGLHLEKKLTPVRRSNRLRNQISMSPNAVKRIAISPP